MIEPKWLEQAYIVQNQGTGSQSNLISDATVDDESISVVAVPYRRFVSKNPSNVSYFQPIMDRLDVVPSKFDIDRGGIILEGKSDYFILRYLFEVLLKKDLALFPALGAGTLNALISIKKGWGLPVRVILDSDLAGKKEKEGYIERFFLSNFEIKTISELCSGLIEIEDILDQPDRDLILAGYPGSTKLTKKNILSFFQENLAAGKEIQPSPKLLERTETIYTELSTFLKNSEVKTTKT